MMKIGIKAVCLYTAMACPVTAQTAEQTAAYLELLIGRYTIATELALDRVLLDSEAAAVARDVTQAYAELPDQTDRVTMVIVPMAALSRRAEHPATRSLAADTTRQLFATALPAGRAGASVQLLDAADPMLQEFQPGLGLASSDVLAAMWLEAANAALPAGPPADFMPDAADFSTRQAALLTEFSEAPPPNQHFISRLDAWAAGVRHSWDTLTPDERDAATAVTLRRDVPGPDLVKKVTGGSEVVLWLGAIDIALSDAERTEYANVVAFFDAGGGAAGVTDILNQRLASSGAGGTIADMGSVMMLRNLNVYNWNNGISSGQDAGGAMLGLE